MRISREATACQAPIGIREHTASQLVLTLRLPKIPLGLRAQAVSISGVGTGTVSGSQMYLEFGIPLFRSRF